MDVMLWDLANTVLDAVYLAIGFAVVILALWIAVAAAQLIRHEW